MSTTPTTGHNAQTFASVLATATALGQMAGQGRDTQVKMLVSITEGSYHNALDLIENKHADMDDAEKLAEAYSLARGNATVFDHKAPSSRKLASSFRTAVKLGQFSKGGNGEPLATMNNLLTHWRAFRKDPAKVKKLDDAANTFLRFARTQLKRDHMVDDQELQAMCYKSPARSKTTQQIIEKLRKDTKALVDGTAAGGAAFDNDPLITQALGCFGDRLRAIAAASRDDADEPADTTAAAGVVTP